MASYPVEGEFVHVEVVGFRGRVHVRQDGPPDAPAVLLVHGFSGSLRWFDEVVAAFRDRVRSVRLDLLGHGATGGPAADAPLQAEVVDAVLERLGYRQGVTAVGHSFGADVAVELAARSERVDRLVIVCQAPDYSDANLPRGNRIMTVPVIGPGVHRSAKALALGLITGMRLVRPHSLMLPLATRAIGDFRALDPKMFRVVLDDRRRRMERRPLDAVMRETAMPSLVVLGGRDHFYGTRSAPRYRAAGAQIVVLPESSHSPTVDAPQRLAEVLLEFDAAVAGTPVPD